MISAWSRLDSTVGEAIARYGLDPGITTLEMLGNLNLTNVISADTLRMAEEANAIVAQVMLGGKLISHAGARKFTQSVDEIIKRVRVEANLDATPIKPRD